MVGRVSSRVRLGFVRGWSLPARTGVTSSVWYVCVGVVVVAAATLGAVRVSRALNKQPPAPAIASETSSGSARSSNFAAPSADIGHPGVQLAVERKLDDGTGGGSGPRLERQGPVAIRISVTSPADEFAAAQSNIFASAAEGDGVIAAVLRAIPAGARVSRGFEVAPGTWVLPRAELSAVEITLPGGLPGPRTASLHLLQADGELRPYASVALRQAEPMRMASLIQAVPTPRLAVRARPMEDKLDAAPGGQANAAAPLAASPVVTPLAVVTGSVAGRASQPRPQPVKPDTAGAARKPVSAREARPAPPRMTVIKVRGAVEELPARKAAAAPVVAPARPPAAIASPERKPSLRRSQPAGNGQPPWASLQSLLGGPIPAVRPGRELN